MLFTGVDQTTPYIAINDNGKFFNNNVRDFSCNLNAEDITDGNYHEIIFAFQKTNENTKITNIWDVKWSKQIIYHEIQFWNGNTLVRDYVPYSKNADYMYDRISKTFIQATISGVYQLI